MIPVKLQLNNFLSYKSGQTIDFTGFNLAILSGNNGVGKSSILEAITWAVWGKSRADSDNDLIHQGETSMWVEFIFDYEGNRYRIVRKRSSKGRGETTLEFQVADQAQQSTLSESFAHYWENLTRSTLKNTQEDINKTLKLDYDLFVNSSYLRQGHADEFTTKMPAERKEILAQILDLSLYDRLEEMAKQKRKDFELRGKLLTAQIEDLTTRVQNKEILAKDLEEAQSARKDLEVKIKGLEGGLKKFENDRQSLALLEREISHLHQRLEENTQEIRSLYQERKQEQILLDSQAKLLEQADEIINRYELRKRNQKELDSLQQKFILHSKLEQQLMVINSKEVDLNKTIERLQHVTICPTCLRSMTKREAEEIITSLIKQFDKETLPEKEELEQKINANGFDEARYNKLKDLIAREADWDERVRQLDIADVSKKKGEEQIKKIALKVDKAMQERKEIEKKGKTLSAEREVFSKKEEAWESLENNLDAKRMELSALQEKIGGLNDRLRQAQEMQAEISEKSSDLKKLAQLIADYAELSLSFGKKGVQAMIIGQVIPLIAEEANLLLQKITGGRMQVSFVTQKSKKGDSEDTMETLDIEIRDELGIRSYEQYSGGEAFRIDFAIRIALAKLLASRAGAKLQFLVVDEGFGSLDSSGRDDIVAAITGIREEFSKIIIVTHIDEFKNLFPTRIEVTKDSEGSRIQMVNQ